MSKFVIIPDSASDLTADLMNTYNIPEIIPIIISIKFSFY